MSIQSRCCSLLLGVVLVTSRGSEEISAPTPEPVVEAVASVTEFVPGAPFYAGVRWVLPEGWHLYWQNPGDSGMAPEIEWSVPTDVRVGPLLWPAPARLKEGEFATFGYTGTVLLVAPVTVHESWAVGRELQMNVAVRWLLCSDTCVPGSTQLTLVVRSAAESRASTNASAIFSTLRRLPRPMPRVSAWVELSATSATIRVQGLGETRPGYLYPREEGLWPAGHDLAWNKVGDRWQTVVPLGPRQPWPDRVRAVLELPDLGMAGDVDMIVQSGMVINRKESSP